MVFILLVLVILVLCLYRILKWKHLYWTRRGVIQRKPAFPFGNFNNVVMGAVIPNEIIREAYYEFKNAGAKFGGLYFMYNPLWIVVDPDLIKQILYKDFWSFSGHGYFYKHKDDILTNNLFNAEGDEWKNLRSKLTPALTGSKLKLMFDILRNLGERLEKIVNDLSEKEESLDIKEVTACFGTDVIANCAFGLECNTLENPYNDFRKYGKSIFKPRFFYELLEQFCNWDMLNLFGHTWLKKDVNTFFVNLVKDMVEYRDTHKITRHDFLHLLMELRNIENVKDKDEENVLTMNDIAANVFVIYAAGYETTSTTISFAMYELARNPDVQEKLRQEIWSICKNRPDNEVTYDDLQNMKYCEMVINETLRIHTVATEVPRMCTSAYKVPGTNTVIEKGTFVLVPSWAIHNDPDFYPNPQIFHPENFSEENKAVRKDVLFLPFGGGPRLCIGYRFGMMQMKMALYKYLKNHRYELNEKTPKEITYEANNVTIVPKGQILLNVFKVDCC